jgi:hypothetical protein
MTMSRCSRLIRHLGQLADTLLTLGVDTIGFLRLWLRSPAALAAENLFLRKQLALYQTRHVTLQRATNATRFTLVWLSLWFDWQPALAIVQPETFSRWCRQGSGLGWFWKSQPGRPPIPMELQALIRQIARDNCTWGQRRIANELQLKLGLQVSPRTVRKYMPTHLDRTPGHRATSQRWRTFVRNHAWDIITRSVSVDFILGVRTLSVRLIQFLLQWWRHAVANGVRGTSQGDAGAIALVRATISVPIAWTADADKVIGVDQRSPPEVGPSCTPDPGLASRATLVNRFDVCPAGAGLHRWNRANPHTQGAGPLRKGGSRTVLWCRAA